MLTTALFPAVRCREARRAATAVSGGADATGVRLSRSRASAGPSGPSGVPAPVTGTTCRPPSHVRVRVVFFVFFFAFVPSAQPTA